MKVLAGGSVLEKLFYLKFQVEFLANVEFLLLLAFPAKGVFVNLEQVNDEVFECSGFGLGHSVKSIS